MSNLVSCTLRVESWSLSDEFVCEGGSFAAPNRDITLFGKVEDSEGAFIDGHTFQLAIGSAPIKARAILQEDHIFVGVSLTPQEIERLERQLNYQGVAMSFSVTAKFQGHYERSSGVDVEGQVQSIRKWLVMSGLAAPQEEI